MSNDLPTPIDAPAELQSRNQAATRILKSRSEPEVMSTAPIHVQKGADGQSKALSTDPWASLINRIIVPPYDPVTLAGLIELSPDLSAAIEAMAANIDGFGYTLQALVNQLDDQPESEDLKRQIADEKAEIENFLDVAGDTQDITALRRKMRTDKEGVGYAVLEVVRDPLGRIAHLNHLPSREMRLGKEDPDPTLVRVNQLQRKGDGSWIYADRLAMRRLRMYVQAKVVDRYTRGVSVSGLYDDSQGGEVAGGADGADSNLSMARCWFKSFGDPRVVDCQTGKVVDDAKTQDFGNGRPMPESRKANEVLYFYRYNSRTPYGTPRWIPALIHVLGNRAAQEINYTTFENNNIPSMAMSASGGRFTQGSIDRIKTFTETHIQGSKNYSTFLILEGESGFEGDESAPVKIDIKPLTGSQHTDSMFSNYTEHTGAEIRKTFRIPSLFLGGMKEINRAAAEEVRRMTDEQVFAPDRESFDREFNATICADRKWKFWKYVSRTPNVTDNKDLVAMLAAGERTGGLTPRIARAVLIDVFPAAAAAPAISKELHGYDPDVPFSLQVAEKVKNMAGGGEINNQIAPVMPAANPADIMRKSDDPDLARMLLVADRARSELARLIPEMAGALVDDHAND